MNLRRLLTTPLPATGWVLEDGMVAAVRHDRKDGFLCAAGEVPAEAVETGPMGLQKVEPALLAAALRPVQEAVVGGRRPAVLVPCRWARMHLLELDELPRRRAELDEVVRWRLKKLVPVRPGDLRLDLVPFKGEGDRWRVLCLSGMERAWESLEEAFEAVGAQPALLTPAAFALSAALPGEHAVEVAVHLETGMLTVLAWRGGQLVLAHTKLLPPGEVAWDGVERELRTVALYLREKLGAGDDPGVLALAGPGLALAELEGRLGALGGRPIVPPPSPPPCPGLPGEAAEALRAVAALHGGTFR